MKIRAYGISDLGRVRKNNEDNLVINGFYKQDPAQKATQKEDNEEREQYLYGVLDGMGGEQHGEQASLLAAQILAEYAGQPFDQVKEQYVRQANQAICDFTEAQGSKRCGTTAAILYLKANRAYAYNIGDSRIYLWRQGQLYLLSVDHTKAWQMAEIGILDFATAEKHQARHILTQHLGIKPAEMALKLAEVPAFSLQKGDLFLLCSDGLNDMLAKEEIAVALSGSASLPEKAKTLVEAALSQGGKDNVTVVLVEALEGEAGTTVSPVELDSPVRLGLVKKATSLPVEVSPPPPIPKKRRLSLGQLGLVLGVVLLILVAGIGWGSWKLGFWEATKPSATVAPAYALELSCPPEIDLALGAGERVKVVLSSDLPLDFDPAEVIWTTDDSGAVVFDSSGKWAFQGQSVHLYAAKAGTSLITANWQDQAKAEIRVKVSPELIGVEQIDLAWDGEIFLSKVVDFNTVRGLKLTAKVEPVNAEYSQLKWRLEDPKTGQALPATVATVSQEGVIACKQPGTFRVLVDAGSGQGAARVSFLKLDLAPDDLELRVGDQSALKAQVLPGLPSGAAISWLSSDERVAVVDSSGTVYGIDGGTAVIIALCEDLSQQCTVTVVGSKAAQEKIQEDPYLLPVLNQEDLIQQEEVNSAGLKD